MQIGQADDQNNAPPPPPPAQAAQDLVVQNQAVVNVPPPPPDQAAQAALLLQQQQQQQQAQAILNNLSTKNNGIYKFINTRANRHLYFRKFTDDPANNRSFSEFKHDFNALILNLPNNIQSGLKREWNTIINDIYQAKNVGRPVGLTITIKPGLLFDVPQLAGGNYKKKKNNKRNNKKYIKLRKTHKIKSSIQKLNNLDNPRNSQII